FHLPDIGQVTGEPVCCRDRNLEKQVGSGTGVIFYGTVDFVEQAEINTDIKRLVLFPGETGIGLLAIGIAGFPVIVFTGTVQAPGGKVTYFLVSVYPVTASQFQA